MGDTSHDPVDHARTTRPRAGESLKNGARVPGLLLVGLGVIAFVICLASFALSRTDAGIASAAVALVVAGVGVIWLAKESKRVQHLQGLTGRGPDGSS